MEMQRSEPRTSVGGKDEEWGKGKEREIGWQMKAVAQCKALLQERNPASPEQVVRMPRTELPDR